MIYNMGCTQCRPRKQDGRILFLGPKDSGKTTAMYYLKFQESVATIPTYGCNVETIKSGRNEHEVWDVGGSVEKRDDFLQFANEVSAIVFFIDCSKGEKGLSIALSRLDLMLAERGLKYCPVAIAANKQDVIEGVVNIETITRTLQGRECMKLRYWKVFPCSALLGDGISAMMKWVDDNFGREKSRKAANSGGSILKEKRNAEKYIQGKTKTKRKIRKVQHDPVF